MLFIARADLSGDMSILLSKVLHGLSPLPGDLDFERKRALRDYPRFLKSYSEDYVSLLRLMPFFLQILACYHLSVAYAWGTFS